MDEPILILSAINGETFKQFKSRMIRELKVVVLTRKRDITVMVDPKTMKAYFFNGVKED